MFRKTQLFRCSIKLLSITDIFRISLFSLIGIPDFSLALFKKQSGKSTDLKLVERYIDELSRQKVALLDRLPLKR